MRYPSVTLMMITKQISTLKNPYRRDLASKSQELCHGWMKEVLFKMLQNEDLKTSITLIKIRDKMLFNMTKTVFKQSNMVIDKEVQQYAIDLCKIDTPYVDERTRFSDVSKYLRFQVIVSMRQEKEEPEMIAALLQITDNLWH